MRRVAITGAGVVAPGGNNVADFFGHMVAGRSFIRPLEGGLPELPFRCLAGVADFDPATHFPPLRASSLDRATQFALVAAREAWTQAGLAGGVADPERAGVFWGTGIGGIQTLEQGYIDLYYRKADRVRALTVPMAMNNAMAAQVGIEFGLCGLAMTYSTACASSANSIGEAFRAIRAGELDLAVAGGSDAPLSYGAIRAWEGLRTLALEDPARPETSCRPFAKGRTGLLLGEGGGALVLEELASARARGASILAELTGYGRSNDATHMTRPEQQGQARAMRLALAEAGLAPERVGYLNAHGTATLVGDAVETTAIRQAFGCAAERLAISSSKSMHGHLMGATGAVEFILAVQAMRAGVIPPTAHLFEPDPDCDLDYVPLHARHDVLLEAVMSNSFAFGGNNVSLLASRYTD